MIKVVIVDDHKMFVDTLKFFLSEDERIDVVNTANSGKEVLAILDKETIDVVVLDIHMPAGMDGEEVLEKIKANFPKVKVLVVSMSDSEKDVQRMFSKGADGYMLKERKIEELVNAIHQVHAGSTFIPTDLAPKLIRKQKAEVVKLTRREKEVLNLVAEGLRDKEIAPKLNIAKVTVETHMRSLRKKLNKKNRTQLALYAKENDLI